MQLRRNLVYRIIHARPRLFIAAVVAVLTAWLLPTALASHPVTRLLISWNIGAGLYVILAAVMMVRSSQAHVRLRARLQDEGSGIILVLTVLAGVASLAAIAGELAVVKDMAGLMKAGHVALAGLTVLTSWAFIHMMFCLHYAHDYYTDFGDGRAPGLHFPNEDQPEYGDFFHFAAIVGTSGQTADVSFTTKAMRRVGTVHCILAYLFNTIVLALLINISASLL